MDCPRCNSGDYRKDGLVKGRQKPIKKSIEKTIAFFDKQIADIDARIEKVIADNPDWSEKDKILQSVPGVGAKTSQVLISALPELTEGQFGETTLQSATSQRSQTTWHTANSAAGQYMPAFPEGRQSGAIVPSQATRLTLLVGQCTISECRLIVY